MSILTREQPMPYVKVKTKGQVTIPAEFRRDLNLKEGDLLEALVEVAMNIKVSLRQF